MDIDQLNIEYGIAGQLKFVQGRGGFPFILINNRSTRALISVYAVQVLSFQPTEESEDLLFLSQKSYYDEGKAIRGGIPVCWPWFGSDPLDLKRPNHGFVRNGLWTVSATEATADLETKVKLRFPESVQSKSYWQQSFALDLEISVGNTLTLELITRNTGVKNELIIDDSAFNRRIRIASAGNKSVVVWNPWTKKSAKMSDLEKDDYQHFSCVETGNVDMDVVEIPPGGEYSLMTNFKIIRD